MYCTAFIFILICLINLQEADPGPKRKRQRASDGDGQNHMRIDRHFFIYIIVQLRTDVTLFYHKNAFQTRQQRTDHGPRPSVEDSSFG